MAPWKLFCFSCGDEEGRRVDPQDRFSRYFASSTHLFLSLSLSLSVSFVSQTKIPQVAYERLLNVNRRVWILPLRFTYKSLIDVRPDGYAVPGQKAPKQIETLVVIPTWGGGSRRFEGGHVTEWGPAYGK